jgi:predicted restriction endonuclease
MAADVFSESAKPLTCAVCGYSRYIEICHVKPVKDFPDEAMLTEINSPDNLIALCPTHHWELDNGLLKL